MIAVEMLRVVPRAVVAGAAPASRQRRDCAAVRGRARAAAPVFYALRRERLPRLPLRRGAAASPPGTESWLGSCPRRPMGPSRSPSSAGRERVASVVSCAPSVRPPATAPASAAAVSDGHPARARPTRPRDLRRAAAHHSRLAAVGLRRWAPPFVPVDVPVGDGAGYVPGRRGRRGRKAQVPLHRGRGARPHALPTPRRDVRAGDERPLRSPLVAWAMRLPRLLRATRCSLSAYVASTMRDAPPGLRVRDGDLLPCPPLPWSAPPLPRLARRRPAWALHAAAHVWANCIVATLSHLAMGRAGAAPPHARAGAPLSNAQRAMWESVHARRTGG